MEQKEIIKAAIAAAILIVSFLVWGFFLDASGVTIQRLVSLAELDDLISRLTSFNFLAFLVFFPISYAILVALTRAFPKRILEAITVISFALSGGVFLLLFSSLQNFLLVGVFYLVSLIALIETAFIKFEELKSLVMLRATLGAMSQGLIIVGIGVFISTVLFVMPVQQELVENFEKTIFSSLTPEDIKEDLAETTSQLVVQTQTETLQQIIETPTFQKLSQKEDEEVNDFVKMMNELFATVQTPEYKQDLKDRLAERQAPLVDQTDFDEAIARAKQKIPIFSLIEKFFWIIAAFAVMSIFLLVSNIIFKPVGAVFGLALGTIILMMKEMSEGQSSEPKQPPTPQNKQPPTNQPKPDFKPPNQPES